MNNPYAPPDPNKPRPPRPPHHPGQQFKQPGPGRAPEQRPQLTPEQIRPVTRMVMVFGLLMLATLFTVELPVPEQIVGPVAGAAACVSGVVAVLRARAVKWRGMLVPMLVGGIALSGFTTTTASLDLAINWDAKVAYAQCSDEALTIAAQERCDTTYQQARLGGTAN